MVWNAVAAIGGSLISGLFGSKKRKEETITDQTSSSTIDYKGMADAAIEGGFNPLTAIRTGGASGFVTTRTQGKNVTTSSGGGGAGAAIGDAIASAGSLFGSFTQPKSDPIRVKSNATGAVSSLVANQLRGGTRAAPALNRQPTQRVLSSPVTRFGPQPDYAAMDETANRRIRAGTFIGPVHPRRLGQAHGGLDLYIPYYDRSTQSNNWGVNPAIMEPEQMLSPPLIVAPNKAADAIRPVTKWTWPNPLAPMRYPKPNRQPKSGGW